MLFRETTAAYCVNYMKYTLLKLVAHIVTILKD
jgi:hypothetical protein